MLKGKLQPLQTEMYYAPHFRKPRYKLTPSVRGSCGTYAFSVLTGRHPKDCEIFLGRSKFWTDRRLVRTLREQGYVVAPITINSVCGTNADSGRKVRLNGMHVILNSQHAYRDEGTYSVFHDGIEYHSGEVGPIMPLELINYPLWTSYLVWHPNWGPRTFEETHVCKSYSGVEHVMLACMKRERISFKELVKKQRHLGFGRVARKVDKQRAKSLWLGDLES